MIGEIERRLRVSEQVIKFITVRMDEEEKRLAKVKALRDSKVKRSALPQQQPAAAATAPVAAEATPEAAPAPAETAAPTEAAALRRRLHRLRRHRQRRSRGRVRLRGGLMGCRREE